MIEVSVRSRQDKNSIFCVQTQKMLDLSKVLLYSKWSTSFQRWICRFFDVMGNLLCSTGWEMIRWTISF